MGRTDYLMVESPPLLLGLSGAWLSGLKHARLIFNVSDLWPESAVRLGVLHSQGLFFRVSTWLEKYCYHRAWLITGQSKSILTNITQRFPHCSTFRLSNGVDIDLFRPDRCTDAARAALSANGRSLVLYAGLHGLAQGLDQVLEAAEVLREESHIQITFIGDGPEKGGLLQRAQNRNLKNVVFLEAQPASEIPAFIAAADIVLVPLKMYLPGAVPSKLYEAMASGRAVVLIAEGEAAEIVREHQAGLVVKPGDIIGLVQALRLLSSQPSLRQTLGVNGRRAAEQHFDRTQIATRFITHLENYL
jgi:glycosyltransferase involved in cell wall biosynthesis